MIFVFGSNLQGIHGAGAAAHAARWCGAIRGQGEGLQGDSYALPTKHGPGRSMSLSEVAHAVQRFKAFAAATTDLTFQVTRVGCGLAGFADEQIAPLFDDAPANCLLPGMWLARRDPGVARVIVAGSRTLTERDAVWPRIETLTRRLWSKSGFEIVSGMADGPDTLAVQWAEHAGFAGSVVKFPADWARYKRAAGPIRNALMSWYSTHLVAFWDGESPGTRNMIETARRDGLAIRVVHRTPGDRTACVEDATPGPSC